MSNLLIVIPCCAADAAMAERLIDWIFLLNRRHQSGHCLLAYAADVHPEMQTKIKLAADVAFDCVDTVSASAVTHNSKPQQTNHLFRTVANHIIGRYKSPWLWLEPDCVPLSAHWIESLAEAYSNQPKRYFGSYLKYPKDGKELTTFARVGIYPAAAASDLKPLEGDKSFHAIAADIIMPRACRCRLIQQLNYANENDPNKIRPDAVLLHSDKTGGFIADRREALDAQLAANPDLAPRRRGRPPKTTQPAEPVIAP